MAISVGSKAPDFNLKSKQASGIVDVKLSNNFGKKNTVLLFFPLAFTSVCTKEMCDVTAGMNAYVGSNADVIGISVDSPFSQEAWAQKMSSLTCLRYKRGNLDKFRNLAAGPDRSGRRQRAGRVRDR